jgi:ribosome biogenesis GTPase
MNKLIGSDTEELITGLITKSVSGTFTAKTPLGNIECKARGIFRKDRITPLAGDFVKLIPVGDSEGVITEIAPRKNVIRRPPAANIDLLVFVCSVIEPETNLLVLDKFLAIAERRQIDSVIAVTKNDLIDIHTLKRIYSPVTDVFEIDYRDNETVENFRAFIRGKTVLFTGNSGVGKTTLLNHLVEGTDAETGEISRKLGRGRHTTRRVEFFENKDGGYIVDTPGFSSLDTDSYEHIEPREIADCFVDFSPFLGKCRYVDCMHIKETGCAVREAVDAGKLSRTRYKSYVTMCEETVVNQRKKFS